MNHVDLFSGIGGFALAASWVWGEDYVPIAHSEVESFPCKVYHKHFPGSECLGDITKIEWQRWLTSNAVSMRKSQSEGCKQDKRGWIGNGLVDLLTGGYPCQPFSVAGKRRGKEDDRHLWPEMLRAIRECHPSWVIAENVAGHINMGLDEVLSNLEVEGYEAETFVIPACAKNAPHRRDRVWIVANHNRSGFKWSRAGAEEQDLTLHAQHAKEQGLSIAGFEPRQHKATASIRTEYADRDAPHRQSERLEGGEQTDGEQGAKRNDKFSDGCGGERWLEPWYDVALRTCVRGMANGLPNRVDRLKSLGNAIVPQVAEQIMRAIKTQMEASE